MANDRLQRAKKLLNQGKFDDALEAVETVERERELEDEELLAAALLKGDIYIHQGFIEKSLKLSEHVKKESQALDKQLLVVDACISTVKALVKQEKYNESLQVIEEGESLLTALTGEPFVTRGKRKAALLFWKGISAQQRGNFDKAVECLRKSLVLHEELDNKYEIAETLYSLGVTYFRKSIRRSPYHRWGLVSKEEKGHKQGIAEALHDISEIYNKKYPHPSLDQALEYHKQSLALREEYGDNKAITDSLTNISQIYGCKNKFNHAIECNQRILSIHKALGDKKRIADAFAAIGNIYWHGKGEQALGLEYSQQSLALYEELDNKEGIAYSLFLLHVIYRFGLGRTDLAFKILQRGLTLVEELGNPERKFLILRMTAYWYLREGEYNLVLEYLQKALTVAEDLDYKGYLADIHSQFGLFYIDKGELDQALEHLHESVTLFNETNFYFENLCTWPLIFLGRIYHDRGNFEMALEFFKRGLALSVEFAYSFAVGAVLDSLITLAIDIGYREQGEPFLRQFKDLTLKHEHKSISQVYRVVKAKFLKASTRLKDKMEAQAIFQQVVNEEKEIINVGTVIEALLHLCELLIYELHITGDEEVFKEVKTLLIKFLNITQAQKSVNLQVNALLLQAQLKAVEGNLQQTTELLTQARVTAEKYELHILGEKAEAEQNRLENEMMKWQELIQRNAPIQERLEHARVEHYIKDAQKMITLHRQR
ncbi:MAG: tetratricopeptide repeat protein [Candidatus Hodarchaeota archaeon]